MRRRGQAAALLVLLALAGCKPPASDAMRGDGPAEAERAALAAQQALPDTKDAFWAGSGAPMRIIYGQPGKPPLVALDCKRKNGAGLVTLTRFAAADPRAQALAAITGNGHIARLPIDATWNGRVWLWEGTWNAADPALDVFTGPREIRLTIPGAGTVALNPGERPGLLIERCRQLGRQPERPQAEAPAPE